MKANKLYRWIVSFLSLMPMLFIGARSLYVSLNKNAYQSYSNNVNQTTNIVLGGTTLDTGLLYTIAYTNGLYNGQTISVMNGKTNIADLFFTGHTWTVKTFSASYEDNRTRLIVYDTNNIQHNCFNWQNINNTFWFYPNENQTLDNAQHNYNVYVTTYVKDSLDNAFTYSIKEFNDVGFNKIQFVTWFTDLFTTSDNIYVQFVNSYANYLLFVSATLVLPYVIYWFINFTIHVMDSFTNKSRKGY